MALHVTQCPRCESTFNTSARVLEAAHGLVRCGACLSIFEADQHFVEPETEASNDDQSSNSVFISAPAEYFDPAEFLNHGEQPEEDSAGDRFQDDPEEILYAKSDEHDSDFDVFDVDPALEESRVQEQLLDSDFDVFDVGDVRLIEEQKKQDLQDSEFDIYDAGERVFAVKPPAVEDDAAPETANRQAATARQEGQELFQVKATFSFSSGMPQDIYIPLSNAGATDSRPDAATPDKDSAPAGRHPAEPADDAIVILPEAPDAAIQLAALKALADSEVILPAGPAAATLLAELKRAGEQTITLDDIDLTVPQSDEDPTDESALRPEEQEFLESAASSSDGENPLEPAEDDQDTAIRAQDRDLEFENAVDDFSDALAEGAEWEEADLDIDESSFVILPADPYQPSSFLGSTAEPDPASARTSQDQTDENQDSEAMSFDPDLSAELEIPTLTESTVMPTDDRQMDDRQDDLGTADHRGKDVIRSRVMATELDDHDDSLEQLSAENLRAVRDVDTTLELEQQKPHGRSRAGYVIGGGLLVALIAALVVFFVRMPVLSQDPRFRSWYESACNLAGCSLPDYVNPGLVQTGNLVVRSHPQRDDALELTAVFSNNARFPQPFPLIELTFSDVNNRTMMVFEFLPDEYLPQALRGMPLMPVGAPVQISLDLADPGPNAVNYRMVFREAPPRPR